MADSSLLTGVIVAAIGLTGTAIGIGGTLLVQLRVEREKQKFEVHRLRWELGKETQRKKAEKLEELITALNDVCYKIEHDADGKIGFAALFSKIQSIQKVYFHEFANITCSLQSEWSKMNDLWEKDMNKAAEESMRKIYDYVGAYIEKIEAYAKHEFQ
jgi:hypothetical protein